MKIKQHYHGSIGKRFQLHKRQAVCVVRMSRLLQYRTPLRTYIGSYIVGADFKHGSFALRGQAHQTIVRNVGHEQARPKDQPVRQSASVHIHSANLFEGWFGIALCEIPALSSSPIWC